MWVKMRLQPDSLYLDQTGTTRQQLSWLLPKLPTTRLLSLASLDFGLTVSALASPSCPSLTIFWLTFQHHQVVTTHIVR